MERIQDLVLVTFLAATVGLCGLVMASMPSQGEIAQTILTIQGGGARGADKTAIQLVAHNENRN